MSTEQPAETGPFVAVDPGDLAEPNAFPPALVERLLIAFDGWDGTLSPSASARALVRLREAADDLGHYTPWHYTAVCAGCPAAPARDAEHVHG